jgi:hypothetical protein
MLSKPLMCNLFGVQFATFVDLTADSPISISVLFLCHDQLTFVHNDLSSLKQRAK